MRAIRRKRAIQKQAQRQMLMSNLGMQGGILYERHRKKIQLSTGYMRDGNVSHFVATKPRKRTRDRNRIGSVFLPGYKDRMKLESLAWQLNDYNGGENDGDGAEPEQSPFPGRGWCSEQ